MKFNIIGLFLVFTFAFANSSCSQNTSGKEISKTTETKETMSMKEGLEKITLGGGCFWCVEAIYQDLEGVEKVESGYSNGDFLNPTYEQVCSKTTGHNEVVQVTYDPTVINLDEILEIFWRTHNPTTLNQQGNDKGPQYRSGVYYETEAQKEAAIASMTKVAPQFWEDPIVTEVLPLEGYSVAEDYHQNYYKRVGSQNGYCTMVIAPKVKKFKELYKDKLKEN